MQIFENKGEIMGCSNPHRHGQIWTQQNVPDEPLKEHKTRPKYFEEKKTVLLSDYLKLELDEKESMVYENKGFVLLVPFRAVWPFETMIISKRRAVNILQFTGKEVFLFADIIKTAAVKYDNIFNVPFPYPAGIHQPPADELEHKERHFYMHFYPPLLRTISNIHYKNSL